MPRFASTDGPRQAVPIKNKRYQIPRWPWTDTSDKGQVVPVPMPSDIEAHHPGTGMLVPWTRASTILDTHEDKEGIFKWTKRLVVKGIGAREDLYALAAATRLEDKAGLLKVADQAFDYAKGQAASNLGTALHGFLERWVEGDKDLVVPSQWKGDVGAVMAAFQDANIRLRPDLQELVVVRPDLKDGDAGGLAGRLDLCVEMLNPETGEWELVLADYKTGSDPLEYGAWKIQQQLGLYGTAWATWDGEFWRPMPKIRRDKILMVHVLPGQASCQIHIGDVDPVVLEEDLAAAYRTRRRRKEAKKAWRPLVTVEAGQVIGEPTLMLTDADPVSGAPLTNALDYAVPVGPTRPMVNTVAQIEDEADRGRAAATVARVAAESNPNNGDEDGPSVQGMVVTAELDRSEPIPGPGAEVLAPLAGPGERGCGVCGRKGHRRGSTKCLGDADPHKAKVAEQQESYARENAGGTMSPEEAAAVPTPDPDEHMLDGHAHDSGHCRCSTRASGWKAPADGVGPWVCGDCGLPSKLGVPLSVQFAQNGGQITRTDPLEKAVGEHLDSNGVTEPDPDASALDTAHVGDLPGAVEEADPSPVSVGLEEDMTADEPDPFDEDGSDALTPAQPSWLERIQRAKDKAELREIRADAKVVGRWATELTQAGLKRIEELKLQEQQG